MLAALDAQTVLCTATSWQQHYVCKSVHKGSRPALSQTCRHADPSPCTAALAYWQCIQRVRSG